MILLGQNNHYEENKTGSVIASDQERDNFYFRCEKLGKASCRRSSLNWNLGSTELLE